MVFLTTLNGCVQGIALLGPAFSYSQSGSVYQAALSYGSNLAFRKMRGNVPTKNTENAFDDIAVNNNNLFQPFKDEIENSSSIKNLANQ